MKQSSQFTKECMNDSKLEIEITQPLLGVLMVITTNGARHYQTLEKCCLWNFTCGRGPFPLQVQWFFSPFLGAIGMFCSACPVQCGPARLYEWKRGSPCAKLRTSRGIGAEVDVTCSPKMDRHWANGPIVNRRQHESAGMRPRFLKPEQARGVC